MIVFVVPLQSPEASRDWEKVSALCRRTIASLCAQTHPGFHLVLSCNRRPAGLESGPSLTILENDFPIPARNTDDRMRDKGRKIQAALIAMRDRAPFHYMPVDADDCVSRRMAAFSAARPDHPGWYLETGYIHDQGTRWLMRMREFHLFCGTSHVMRVTESDLPRSMDEPESAYWVLLNGISTMVSASARRGTPMEPLPFIGAVYNTDTGENDSDMALRTWHSKKVLLKKLYNTCYLTGKLRDEFTLHPLSRYYSP